MPVCFAADGPNSSFGAGESQRASRTSISLARLSVRAAEGVAELGEAYPQESANVYCWDSSEPDHLVNGVARDLQVLSHLGDA
nr:hypothetical protein [Atopobium sp. oral taxon 810]